MGLVASAVIILIIALGFPGVKKDSGDIKTGEGVASQDSKAVVEQFLENLARQKNFSEYEFLIKEQGSDSALFKYTGQYDGQNHKGLLEVDVGYFFDGTPRAIRADIIATTDTIIFA